jgi:hypothetical protein
VEFYAVGKNNFKPYKAHLMQIIDVSVYFGNLAVHNQSINPIIVDQELLSALADRYKELSLNRLSIIYTDIYSNLVTVIIRMQYLLIVDQLTVQKDRKGGRNYFACKKSKEVPQHTCGGAGWRGGIAPTHSRPRH